MEKRCCAKSATSLRARSNRRNSKAYASAVDHAKRRASHVNPSSNLVRERRGALDFHAEPSPSGLPNHVAAKFWESVRRGWNTVATDRCVDCGQGLSADLPPVDHSQGGPIGLRRARRYPLPTSRTKVRPTGLADSLTKLADGCAIQMSRKDFRRQLAPGNLGIVASGEAPDLHTMLEAWADDIEAYNSVAKMEGRRRELDAIEAADLTIAYGTYLRAAAVSETFTLLLALAGVIAAS